MASESENKSQTESQTVKAKPLKSSQIRIRNFDPSNATVTNMTVIWQEMEDQLNGPQPGSGRFVLTESDKAWEKMNIIALTLKLALSLADICQKTWEEIS